MTPDSFTSTEGATSGGSGGGGGNSFSQRTSLPSPWAQVVRGGGESDAVASRSPTASPAHILTEQNPEFVDQSTTTESQAVAVVESQPEGSEGNSNGNASGVKKSAWNKPSANGVIEGSKTPVMGAASWPALSELNRPLPKSSPVSSESSSKPTSDGSVTVSQAPAVLQPPQRHVRNNANHHPNQHQAHSVRPRSLRGGGAGAGGGFNRPPSPPTPPPMPPPYPFYDVSYRAFVPVVLDSSVREQSSYNGSNFAPRPIGGVGSHSHAVHDHSSNRKRNNFGPRPRGDGGLYLNNGHGGRRDHQDRDWRAPRSHAPIPPQMVPPPPPLPRGYIQQAHMGPATYMAPSPIRPYGPPIGYELAPQIVYLPTVPPDPYRGPPFPPRAAPLPMNPAGNVVDTPLPVRILNQIEYYFSDANLVKDDFLRLHMDEEGWVPITLVAGFRRVQILTSDIPMILNCLRDSTIVEVKGETVRRRNEWKKYLKPADSSSQSARAATSSSTEETSMRNLSLDAVTAIERSTADANDTKDVSTNP